MVVASKPDSGSNDNGLRILVKVRVKLPVITVPMLVTLNIWPDSVHATTEVLAPKVRVQADVTCGTVVVGKVTMMIAFASRSAI